MPRSGCSALHGVSQNKKKKNKNKKNWENSQYVCGLDTPGTSTIILLAFPISLELGFYSYKECKKSIT